MKGFIIFRNDEVWEADDVLLSPAAAPVDDKTVWPSFSGPPQRFVWAPEPDEEDDDGS